MFSLPVVILYGNKMTVDNGMAKLPPFSLPEVQPELLLSSILLKSFSSQVRELRALSVEVKQLPSAVSSSPATRSTHRFGADCGPNQSFDTLNVGRLPLPYMVRIPYLELSFFVNDSSFTARRKTAFLSQQLVRFPDSPDRNVYATRLLGNYYNRKI